MKKLLIPALALVAAGILLLTVPAVRRFRYLRYGSESQVHYAVAADGGWVKLSADGGVREPEPHELQTVYKSLMRSERSLILALPDGLEGPVTAEFSDGAIYRVWRNPSQEDESYIDYDYNGSRAVFRISGYRVYELIYAAAVGTE